VPSWVMRIANQGQAIERPPQAYNFGRRLKTTTDVTY